MPKASAPTGLLFSFAEMEREISSLADVASPFLEEFAVERTIRPWLQQLKNLRSCPSGTPLRWQIPQKAPLQTVLSVGEYEPNQKGGHSLRAELSAVWQIQVPDDGIQRKRGTNQPAFALVGLASTRISIVAIQEGREGEELARWRFEMGDAQSPGCHFHSQVLGDEADTMFPKTMSVPRLPNMLFTPMDGLEFVLGELFQDRWRQHASKSTEAMRLWAGCQRHRLLTLLQWQVERLKVSSGSPWTALKAAKPDAALLVGRK